MAAYWDVHGELIVDTMMIAHEYAKFWLWVDVVCTVPWDVILSALEFVPLPHATVL